LAPGAFVDAVRGRGSTSLVAGMAKALLVERAFGRVLGDAGLVLGCPHRLVRLDGPTRVLGLDVTRQRDGFLAKLEIPAG